MLHFSLIKYYSILTKKTDALSNESSDCYWNQTWLSFLFISSSIRHIQIYFRFQYVSISSFLISASAVPTNLHNKIIVCLFLLLLLFVCVFTFWLSPLLWHFLSYINDEWKEINTHVISILDWFGFRFWLAINAIIIVWCESVISESKHSGKSECLPCSLGKKCDLTCHYNHFIRALHYSHDFGWNTCCVYSCHSTHIRALAAYSYGTVNSSNNNNDNTK